MLPPRRDASLRDRLEWHRARDRIELVLSLPIMRPVQGQFRQHPGSRSTARVEKTQGGPQPVNK